MPRPSAAAAATAAQGGGRGRRLSLSWRSDHDSIPSSKRPIKKALSGMKFPGKFR